MTTTPSPRLAARRRAVHAAARQLGMDDATRRDMLDGQVGKRSTTDLTMLDCEKVLDHLARLGAGKPAKAKPGRQPGQPHNIDRVALLQKIEALLADMELPWAYADAIARQQTRSKGGIERLAWVPDKDLAGVVAALDRKKKGMLAESWKELHRLLAMFRLNEDWAYDRAKALGRLNKPWRWRECLETLRLIADELKKYEEANK